jgi:crossover junction endodeoxyribonuclease RuvC
MIILGIDPGTICAGYGIIEKQKGSLSLIIKGVIKLPPKKPLPLKLEIIYDEIDRIIKLYKPDEFAIETAFYGKNVQSAMKIGYARGVAMLAAVHNKLPVSEYSPKEVKKSVVGYGAANKRQVQYMINHLLGIKETEPVKTKKAGRPKSVEKISQSITIPVNGNDYQDYIKKMKYDESDALAVAICHSFRIGSILPKKNSWKSFIEAYPERVIA